MDARRRPRAARLQSAALRLRVEQRPHPARVGDAPRRLPGIALTHDHHDHSGAVAALLAKHPAPLAAARAGADVALGADARFGPFAAVPTPGHAPDHFALIARGACFTGDSVLGEGSVFISA